MLNEKLKLLFNLVNFQDFEISPEILRRVSQAKGKGKLVCNLLRALFTRQELATSSLKGKGQKGERRVLDASKVEALTGK